MLSITSLPSLQLRDNVLSARIPPLWLWRARPLLPPSAELPRDRANSSHHTGDNNGVGLPVVRLGVPATRGRPDMLGVSSIRSSLGCDCVRRMARVTYGTLGPPPCRAVSQKSLSGMLNDLPF